MFNQRLGTDSFGNILQENQLAYSGTQDTYHPPRALLSRQQRVIGDQENQSSASPSHMMGHEVNKLSRSSEKGSARWSPRINLPTGRESSSRGGDQALGSGHGFSLRDRLSKKMARLSSLDSTRSSSSTEVESQSADQQRPPAMPLISITSNDLDQATMMAPSNEHSQASGHVGPNFSGQQQETNISNLQRRRRLEQQYNNYYGRPRIGLARDKHRRGRNDRDDDDEEEDEDDIDYDNFEDPPLPIPYSSSSMSRSNIVRQVTGGDFQQQQQQSRNLSYPHSVNNQNNNYDDVDPLDDRQGMNDSEQQFTKGEKLNRASLDGSIISEVRLDGSDGLVTGPGGSSSGPQRTGSTKGGGKGKDNKQRRSKSPSSSSFTSKRNRHSRRGILGFASRLKLTRKHESIAKLQLSILNSRFVSLKTLDRDLQTFLPRERMSPKDFQERVKLIRKYQVLATIEYRFASKYETYVCRHATQESNQSKNNYKRCLPYDYNRVVLKSLPNVPDSDYINASHVDSYLKPNAYIAAQGPNENTIEDFWRMIWEQKTFVVVMLTKVFDFIRVMCNQYWPVELNKPERYGNLEVTLLYEEPLADFVIRTIKLRKLKNNHRTSMSVPTKGAEASNSKSTENQASTSPVELNVNFNLDKASMKDLDSDEVDCSDEDDDLDYDDEDDDLCTSDSEQGFLRPASNLAADGQPLTPVNTKHLPSVRAPKFVSRPGRRGLRQARSNSAIGGQGSNQQQRRLSKTLQMPPQSATGDLLSPTTPRTGRSSSQPPEHRRRSQNPPVNEFLLHPLFTSTSQQLLTGSGSSLPSTPQTPLTPRTPSSAGLDRSSATRRAVKKKRRERAKNKRPIRTQFQVPDESQLIDDDDEQDQLIDATSGGNENGGKSSSDRIIYQFHYNSWASHTCPFISSLLHFRRRVRICMDEMSKSGKTGPTIVHCNDGCGRTGTYLCIDANLELAEEDNCYDVYNYTKKMRQSRKFLIENLEQYKFVYDTIEEAMFCGKTWFPVSELHKRLKHKSQRNPITKKNEYLREYEKITRMTSKFSIGDCAGGHRVENREKNRDVSTVPPDNFRPYLTSFQSNDNTDYINAVFVDGYTRSKEYIVTEWPLHKTISDFWSLIYDHDCNSVILLANPSESSTYPSFLPSEKELRRKFGPVFSAEMVSYTHYQNIKSWIYTINKKIVSLTEVIAGVKSEAKTTQVFQITCWPQGHRVPTSTNALVELMNMVERWRQRTTYGPVCVVSLNGKSRAGVYCAANVAIEQVVQHSEVDVFQAVKTVRRHRPQLIENMTEYKYCYDLILHYVLHYVNQNTANG